MAFLYLMMRDEVPTGTVCKIIQDSEPEEESVTVFSNPHLAALADDYACRILDLSSTSETAESG